MRAAKAQARIGRILALDPARPSTISSSRRFRKWGNVEATAEACVSSAAYKAVKHACEGALVLWPNAQAAILFGSRVRGNHHDESDWDVAFVTSTDESPPSSIIRIFEELRKRSEIEVQAQAISQAQFHEDADSFGSIAAPIAREGRLIAGHCEWPTTESEPVLKPDDYQDLRGGALGNIATATMHLATAIDNARRGEDRSAFKKFVADSSDAAEFCAKIAFGRLASGTSAAVPRRHQVNEIVEILDRVLERHAGVNSKWWQSDRGEKFRDLLCRMNGHGNDDHQFGYPKSKFGAEAVGRAANRIVAAASFAILEVEKLPGNGGLRQVAREVAVAQWTPVQVSVRRLRQALQDFDPHDSILAAGGSAFVESVSVAVSFGDEVVQAVETLADSLYAEMGSARRTLVDPVIYVIGFRPDGKPLAIADTPEAIMNRADEISGTWQSREGAGSQLLKNKNFDQALNIIGFDLVPTPRILAESEAAELAKNRKGLDADEFTLREALTRLLR